MTGRRSGRELSNPATYLERVVRESPGFADDETTSERPMPVALLTPR